MDGDGNLDIVCANVGQHNTIYFGDGTGMFAGSSRETLLPPRFGSTSQGSGGSGSGIRSRSGSDSGSGSGSGGNSESNTSPKPSFSVALADLNNDGLLDVVIGNKNYPDEVHFNTGLKQRRWVSSTFGDEAPTYQITTGDIDGDGFVDIGVAVGGGQNHVFFNDDWHRTTMQKTESTAPTITVVDP